MENKRSILESKDLFCKELHEKMNRVAPVCNKMEPYEFRYSLNNITPQTGEWSEIQLDSVASIEKRIYSDEFYDSIAIKPKLDGEIVLDETITTLTHK